MGFATNTMKKRILVTGATGTVGSEVVRALGTHDDVIVRLGVRRPDAVTGDIERVHLDFDAVETFDAAFRDVDAFFFVSPLTADQAETGLCTIEAARRAGVAHCVRLSSRATGWDDVSVLREWHRTIEKAIVESGMTWTMLRPCSFMQNVLGAPRDRVRTRGVLSLPLGAGRIPFVDAADLGDVAAMCLRDAKAHHAQTYVLTGAVPLGGQELADVLAAVRGAPVRYAPSDPEQSRAAAIESGVPDWLVDSGLRVYARAEHGEEGEVDETLARLLGRAPGTFEAFAERNRAAFSG